MSFEDRLNYLRKTRSEVEFENQELYAMELLNKTYPKEEFVLLGNIDGDECQTFVCKPRSGNYLEGFIVLVDLIDPEGEGVSFELLLEGETCDYLREIKLVDYEMQEICSNRLDETVSNLIIKTWDPDHEVQNIKEYYSALLGISEEKMCESERKLADVDTIYAKKGICITCDNRDIPSICVKRDGVILKQIISWSIASNGDCGFSMYEPYENVLILYGYGDCVSSTLIDLTKLFQ